MIHDVEWVTFTRRTDDPKLGFLEKILDVFNIKHRRHGRSFHAPILQVHSTQITQAWEILEPELDELPDDDVSAITIAWLDAIARQAGQ